MSYRHDHHDRDRHERKRRRSRSRSRDRSSRRSRDGDQLDFDRYRSKLSKIFFRPEDLISHGSNEYREFWQFVYKYQAVEKAKRAREKERINEMRSVFPSQMEEESNPHGISPVYDKTMVMSFKLQPEDPKDLINRIPYQDRDEDENYLTESTVMEFRFILTLYLDMLQREKFNKLRKLRKAQAELPIADYRNEILSQVEKNQVVIVAGDTGCGKSTQVPQYLLQAGYEGIACTQPRRIACISLAKRVGYETLNEFGTEIGYQIRFERKRTDKTKVLFLTEGLLLRQVTADPSLGGYSVIVLDEVHERHLHGDFLLGIVKCLVSQREDLKVILMSATINIKLFQDYFNDEAPVIQVPGRLYPISLKYFPVPDIEKGSSTSKLNPAPYVRILQLIDQKYPVNQRGDVLIFLSGIKEITAVYDAAKEYGENNNKWIVLQLHSTLSLADQDKVFDYPPEGVRKCIVSTNIAETSITIDGVRFVVDSGKVKEMQYDPVSKMQRLKEFWISRASAEQRKGRAGRTGPGTCFRLFSDSEFKALAAYSTPEIQRVPLDNLILQMISMGLPDARKFPFIEPPPGESVENSILVLKEQGALNEDESLTITGKMLSNLPVDVTIGKMLIMGTMFHQIDSVLSLAAALSVQSPFTNDAYRDSDCIAARKNLDSDHGDPITLLNAYTEWLSIKASNSEPSRKWCKKRGLEEQRFYEMTKLRAQFKELLEQSGLLKKEDVDGQGGAAGQLTSAERAERHGEMKHLRDQKRKFLKSEGPKKKKFLKMRGYDDQDQEDYDKVDLKDIEFRMKNDGRKVRDLLEGSKAYSYKDLTILKMILSSGLYPQLALADEFNSCKNGPDALFHTKVKPFNVLHPNCIFTASPEFITLESLDTVAVPGFPGKYPVSAKHQLLVYLSLLETNKPYVVNTLRMPALQTVMMFAQTIDSNGTFSRLVFDSWLEIRFPHAEEAANMLWRAARLRCFWDELLTLRLEDTMDSVETAGSDPIAGAEKQSDIERKLARGLVDLVHTETLFCVRRLLPGDLKVLYLGEGKGLQAVDTNPFSERHSGDPNEKKGGRILTKYLTYNCLENSGAEAEQMCANWKCPMCEKELYVGPLTRLGHYADCSEKEEEKMLIEEVKEDKKRGKGRNPLAKEFHCEVCDEDLMLTMTEILKHKRSHRK